MKTSNNKSHYSLFISDLHLEPTQKKLIESFERVLQQAIPHADAIYILGDLFDAWIGDDDNSVFAQEIIQILRNASQQGLAIHLLTGNRDFLLGNRFAAACGINLLPDPSVITLYGQKILLMHGDSLCTFDRMHQFWFKLTRHRFNQSLALAIPLNWRRQLAQYLRNKSHRHQQNTENYKLDVNPDAVTKILQQYQVHVIIHGHTHRPGIHNLNCGEDNCTRIVLGAWHHHASVLRYEQGGAQFTLQEIPF